MLVKGRIAPPQAIQPGSEPIMPTLANFFDRFVLDRPRQMLVLVGIVTAILAAFIPGFQLDASGDSLLLEEDADLRYYRSVVARYGSDNFVVVTYRARRVGHTY